MLRCNKCKVIYQENAQYRVGSPCPLGKSLTHCPGKLEHNMREMKPLGASAHAPRPPGSQAPLQAHISDEEWEILDIDPPSKP